MSGTNYDGHLPSWSTVRDKHEWTGILVGNGASRAVWDGFKYKNLYRKTKSMGLLTSSHLRVFTAFRTANFEAVLMSLHNSAIVTKALACPVATRRAQECYAEVRTALGKAIQAVHVKWEKIPAEILERIRAALREYKWVFTTNYDLILYWAIMTKSQGEGFKDFLWSPVFNEADTDVPASATKVLYLHGGLHIYQRPTGEVFKQRADAIRNLLSLFESPPEDGALPLLVTEGHSESKMQAIRGSDYLRFALRSLREHKGGLVIFGHSLSPGDRHLVQALEYLDGRRLAIGILPGSEPEVRKRQIGYEDKLKRLNSARISFFDATTHPLGSEALAVAAD